MEKQNIIWKNKTLYGKTKHYIKKQINNKNQQQKSTTKINNKNQR
jgi:hypothetical protein